ncbi:Lsr2 family protein [Streptomyces sp. NBC_01261]|uniref:histone-like nucleoid-structuring protein Lsr2 n=1 Tax=Streptomyces sp. NBC_01261 TaxID=2903802 RepID=UPI002E325A0E|nr:Lsr2 family protein [Streptomyces sp. NBC_01261]
MVQKRVLLLTDDISGGEADQTMTFGLDGRSFEIDLNDKNAEKLRKALKPYVEAGRKTGGRTAPRRHGAGATSGGGDTAAIRAWAKENGFEVNDRGRVPANIRDAYAKANG